MDPYNRSQVTAPAVDLVIDPALAAQIDAGLQAHKAANGMQVRELTCPRAAAPYLDPSGMFRRMGWLRVA